MGFHSVTQTQSQTEPKQNPLVPVTCYLPISPIAVSQLLKKLGCFSAADVTYYPAKVSRHD